MKLYTLTIPENIAPGRLFPWLRRMLPQLPEYAVREALDRRDVKLNGKRVDRQAIHPSLFHLAMLSTPPARKFGSRKFPSCMRTAGCW